MPFVNQKQRIACYAQAAKAKKQGKKPKWNCKEWDKHSETSCGAKCKDGYPCERKCKNRRCWQHKN